MISEEINEKKWQKMQTEKQLALMKKNREKMREITSRVSEIQKACLLEFLQL